MIRFPFIVLSLTLFLTGCDSHTGVQQWLGATGPQIPNTSTRTIQENKPFDIDVSADIDHIAIDQNGDVISGTLTNNTVSLSSSDIDRPSLARVVAFSGDTARHLISVRIVNASARPLVLEVQTLLNVQDRLFSLAEAKGVYESLLWRSQRNGKLSQEAVRSRLKTFQPHESGYYRELLEAIIKLSTARSAYQAATVGDLALNRALDNARASITKHSHYGALKIQQALEVAELDAPELTAEPLTYREQAGVFSRYTGNTHLGSYNANSTWQFNSEHAFLADLSSKPSSSLLSQFLTYIWR